MESYTRRARFFAIGFFLSLLVVGFNYDFMAVRTWDGGLQELKQETTTPALSHQEKKKIFDRIRKSRSPKDLIITEAEFGNITVEYVPLADTCQVPAQRKLDGYRNLCWSKSGGRRGNDTTLSGSELNKKGLLACAPRITLLGIRKSGTTDMSGWFRKHSGTLSYNIDFLLSTGKCITEQVFNAWQSSFPDKSYKEIYLQKNNLYNDAPGQILQHKNLGFTPDGRTLRVQTGLQHLQPVTTPETRYVVILRDPAERAISQLYEWHKMNLIPEFYHRDLTAEFIHDTVVKQLRRTRWCFMKYGPSACIYMSAANDGNRDALLLWGLYAEYLTSAFTFIPREQIKVVQLDEYSRNETETMKEVFEFAGLPYQNLQNQERVRLNKRKVREPLEPTLALLREFYRPFNRRLAELLSDDKWCFHSC